MSAQVTQSPQSLFAAMLRTPGTPGPLRRLRWLAVLVGLCGFLAYPISDLRHRALSPAAGLGIYAALAVFALLWLRTMWLSLATTAEPTRLLSWFIAAASVGAPLALALGPAGTGFNAIFIYLSIAAAVSLPPRATFPAVLACTGAAGLLMRRVPHVNPGAVYSQLSLVFWLGAMMLFYRKMMVLVIELRQARKELARMAVTAERLRIARDLHDLLGHSLSTISLKAQLARRLGTCDPAVAAEIGDIESVAANALTEVREAVTGYRATGLAVELVAARAVLAAAGIQVSEQVDTDGLSAPTDTLLGWVVREAVTNVTRHSRAGACTIRLSRDEDGVLLEVHDDGPGGPGGRRLAAAPGNGLIGLAERVEAAGGRLSAGPAPQRGYRLAVALPLVTTFAGPAPTW